MGFVIGLLLASTLAVGSGLFLKGAEDRIIGGSEAMMHSAPFMLSLQVEESIYGKGPRHYCGAVILSNNRALTSADCCAFTQWSTVSSYYLLAGRHNIAKDYEPGQQRVGIREIVRHPKFNLNTKWNFDICVLKLETDLTFNSKVNKINLPPAPYAAPAAGTTLTMYGWGYTVQGDNSSFSQVLHKVDVPVTDYATCKNQYTSKGSYFSDWFADAKSHLCAGVGGKGGCEYDKGNPLVKNNVLYGLYSFADGCAHAGLPGVYSEVGNSLTFIKKNL